MEMTRSDWEETAREEKALISCLARHTHTSLLLSGVTLAFALFQKEQEWFFSCSLHFWLCQMLVHI